MEGAGGSLRVLSRSSPLSSSSSSASTQSSASSSVPLSSSSIPYTSAVSSFNFPPPPSHTASPPPSYPPPCPPSPSLSLLNSSVSARALPTTNNLIHPGGKITILTSSASSLSSSVSSSSLSSIQSHVPADVSYSAASGQGQSALPAGEAPSIGFPGNGVVVVGAIGRAEEDVSQLLNRLLDAQVFGSRVELSQENNVVVENTSAGSGEAAKQVGKSEDEQEGQPDKVSTVQFPHSMDGSHSNWHNHTLEGKDSRQPDMSSDHFHDHKNLKDSKKLDWMRSRLIYHYDEGKGVVYVQFAWGSLPTNLLHEDSRIEWLSSLMEKSEGTSLRGLLFMFSVCHVILLVQEGARVDTHLLRTLRILQNAKHLFAPFVRTQVLPGLQPSAIGRGSAARPLRRSSGHSPGRSGAAGRNASTIALMSGSAPSLFPGQCTPVLVFVFLEDFADASVNALHVSPHNDDIADSPGSNISYGGSNSQSVGPIVTSRQSAQLKGSNPVVMLARSANKGEGGLRKKLHSSLEAQIRFLVKKCKILAGSGDTGPGAGSGMGPRGPGSGMGSVSSTLVGSALFVLDTTRVVCLVDKGPNRKGDSLEAAMGVMNDMLKGKEVADDALMDLKGHASEDIQAIRDFLWKQAEILRGRGGVLTNSTGGSMGVGMVAAAAAAAAASAAAGAFGGSGGALKSLGNPPELPSMSSWLSACQILVEALVAGEGQPMVDAKKVLAVRVAQSSRSSRKGTSDLPNLSTQGKDALGATLGSLECGIGLDMKFSEEWCKRMLPLALAVYKRGLPPCYPTPFHKSHIQKALRAFQAMVRGPAVPLYRYKLQEECEAEWKSGRQLCDAVSLTGKPCIYKVHDVLYVSADKRSEAKVYENMDVKDTSNYIKVKPHSSGVVFLHACACGRLRKLRDDPFDYENANVTFFQFPNCENLLPSLKIPDCEGNKPLGGSAWSLVRLGGANYYQPSTGLLQSGFCHNSKFLSTWTISFLSGSTARVTHNHPVPALGTEQQECLTRLSRPQIGTMSFLDALGQGKVNPPSGVEPHDPVQARLLPVEKKSTSVEKAQAAEGKQGSVKGYSLMSDERVLFANVVARNSCDSDMAFPPLQQRQMLPPGSVSVKNVRQAAGKEKKDVTHGGQEESCIVGKVEQVVSKVEHSVQGGEDIPMQNGERFRIATPLRMGGVSLFTNTYEKLQEAGMLGVEHSVVHLGFEHECPRGHRFLLSPKQIEALGSTAVQNGEASSKNMHKSKVLGANARAPKHQHKVFQDMEHGASPDIVSISGPESSLKPSANTMASSLKVPDRIHCKVLDDGSGEGYSLLNMNLPIYMACPYCRKMSDQSKKSAVSFAGNVSQLQRIFLVTPPLPLLIATCPVVQFDKSCVPEIEHQRGTCSNEFSLGCSIVLPPESFVVFRLPFVYYVELDDGSRYPLKCKTVQPENTACLLRSSTFRIVSNDGSVPDV